MVGFWRPARARVLARACLCASLPWLLVGCEGFSFISNVFAPERVKAVHRIENRPTLVLVDDPAVSLGNPALVGLIESRVRFELMRAGAVKEVIDPQRLSAYRITQGQDFARTPVDQVGRDLGAAQVVHVWIAEASVRQESPNLLRAAATARVKVIDAPSGRRLFPAPAPAPGSGTGAQTGVSEPGYPVTVHFDRQVGSDMTQGEAQVLGRELADRLGRDVARLFFDYTPRQPGQPWDD